MRAILLSVILGFNLSLQAQQAIRLLTEDFERLSNVFVYDTGTVTPWVASGPNQWILNDEFDGGGIYPNTVGQDSITGATPLGTINNSPFSTYLHIHDTAAVSSGVANANYNPSQASDRFAYTYNGFCTRGLTDVELSFFYLCEGSADAYGEVWFSVDNGPWQNAGGTYSNQGSWNFKTVTNPAFNNVTNLRFGFRWVNDTGSPPSSTSFSLDEIFLIGFVDELNPVTITITDIFPSPPDSVCLQYPFYIEVLLSQSLCAGAYRLELSDPLGNFNSPNDLGTYLLGDDRPDFLLLNSVPGTFAEGDCYRVRLLRLDPPMAISAPSACFKVSYCENTIFTLQPVVTTDLDTVCSQSAIDVPFYSYGVYFQGNVYTAQLSDSAGNFEYNILAIDTMMVVDTTVIPPDTTFTYDTTSTVQNVYQVIGTLPTRATYDPNLPPFMPGTVSGLIPRISAESCQYRIRVVASRPTVTGFTYGPFCIEQCDITTNNTIDIGEYCITDYTGVSDTIELDIHSWDSVAIYDPSNIFQVQLLDMMFFQVVNTGGLGIKMDTASGTMIIIIPGRIALAQLGILPGTYYMRIIGSNSNTPWNLNGTLIRITIGAPKDIPPVLVSDFPEYCNTQIGTFPIQPYNDSSDYQILNALVNNGAWLTIQGGGFTFDFSNIQQTRALTFYVREVNYGCEGDPSPPLTVTIHVPPELTITGKQEVCKGDTFTYSVPFTPLTFYRWSVSWGNFIDSSRNQMIITFDSTGNSQIDVYAENYCGRKDTTMQVNVFSLLEVEAGDNRTICVGEAAALRAESLGITTELRTTFGGGSNFNGNMFDLTAKGDLTITGFSANLPAMANASIAIYYRQASYVGAEYDPSSWSILNIASNVQSLGFGIPTPIPIPVNITMLAGQTFGFYITTTDGSFLPGTVNNGTNPLYTDPYLEFSKGTGNVHPFLTATNNIVWNGLVRYKTLSGLTYLWNDGTIGPDNVVNPALTTSYSVLIQDTAGCSSKDIVTVNVNPLPDVVASPRSDAYCIGSATQLNATGADRFEWLPADNISDPNSANPVATPQRSTLYVVKGTYDATGCVNYDTTDITVFYNEETLMEVNLCEGESYFAGGGEQTGEGTFYDTMIAIGNGCDSVIITTIAISPDGCDLLLVIPQAFTPNNDNVNDHFTVFGDNIDEYEIRIFNRWGEQVYFSANTAEISQGDMTRGWDGTHNGKPQDTGVYVYHIKARKNAEPSVERKGNVTLIR